MSAILLGVDPRAPKSRRGFAGMDPQLRRELASKGGRKAQESGKARRLSSDEAKAIGALGGKASQALGKGHRFDSETGRAASKRAQGKRG